MIEDSKIVKEIKTKQGGKSGTYWTVIWEDGKMDNIFNREWLPLLEQSQDENVPLHFTKEKSGKFYNIKTLEVAEEELPEKEVEQKVSAKATPNVISPQEKGMFWKEIGENFRAGLFKKDDNAAGSYLWRAYVKQMLASLEITIPKQEVKSRLVEESKKLGAEEIEEGE